MRPPPAQPSVTGGKDLTVSKDLTPSSLKGPAAAPLVMAKVVPEPVVSRPEIVLKPEPAVAASGAVVHSAAGATTPRAQAHARASGG